MRAEATYLFAAYFLNVYMFNAGQSLHNLLLNLLTESRQTVKGGMSVRVCVCVCISHNHLASFSPSVIPFLDATWSPS